MNVIFLDWPCFGREDCVNALKALGHEVSFFFHEDYNMRKSAEFDAAFDTYLQNHPADFLFSFNFYPLVSEGCKRNQIKYISIVYDAPLVALYSYTIVYPCNYVFLFDKTQYLELYNLGIRTVYYMPLPGNADKITKLLQLPHDRDFFASDISFVGSLYNEDHNFFDRLTDITDYTRGYLEAIMEAQLRVYGYYFIEEVLPKRILDDMKNSLLYEAGNTGIQTDEYIYGSYFLGRKITELDRIRTIKALGEEFPVKLFTRNPDFSLPGVTNMGTVDYNLQMPYVFYYSKINLNITLRSIKSGMPLRAIDIMSNGGFLMTNYQADFLDFFVPDEDFVYYTDLADLKEKVRYYLSHEEERARIAKNGQEKIRKFHSFEQHFCEIFAVVFPEA